MDAVLAAWAQRIREVEPPAPDPIPSPMVLGPRVGFISILLFFRRKGGGKAEGLERRRDRGNFRKAIKYAVGPRFNVIYFFLLSRSVCCY